MCSIAEYFCELYKQRVNILGNTTHHKPNNLSIIKLLYFICNSYKAEKVKWKEKRNTCNRLPKDVFFTVQNNQLYKIVRYLYSFRAIFVLFLVKLGNKSEVSLSDPFCQFLDKFTRISINVLASSQISFILSLFRILNGNEDEKLLFSSMGHCLEGNERRKRRTSRSILLFRSTKELTMFFRYFYWRRGRREVKSRRARLPFALAPSRWIHRWLLCLFREFP